MPIDFTQIPSPCFVLDEAAFKKNIAVLKDVQERSGARIIPALKGFAMWKSFPEIRKHFHGGAASSLNEARLCVEELGAKAHVYSPAYSEEEFGDIIRLASHVTFNSLSQWEKFRSKLTEEISPGIRVNPGFSPVKTELYNPCAPGSRLGVPLGALPREWPEDLEGLHVHALCESGVEPLEKIVGILEQKCGGILQQLKWLNLGGGHLITGDGYDLDRLVELLIRLQEKYSLKVILEPGAAFAWRAGYLVCKVQDVVEYNGVATAMLDVSFAAHIPDCLDMPYQPDVLGAEKNTGKYQYRLGGNSCLAGDYVGMYGFPKPLETSDTIVFEDMMHYTMVKTTHFNGVTHPSIGIWKTSDSFELWREFGYEDYKGRLS